MKPLIPLSYLKKSIERLPDFDTSKSHFFRHVFSVCPKVEFEWEKSDILKEWILVKVIMEETEPFETVKPFTVGIEVDQRPSSSIFDLLDMMENGKDSVGNDASLPLIVTHQLPPDQLLYYTGQTDPHDR